MRVATPQEMSSIDQQAIHSGIPMAALMESAGKATAFAAKGMIRANSLIGVLCGSGNNGGDGLVAARYLANAGHNVKVFITTELNQLSGLMQGFAGALINMGVEIFTPDTISSWPNVLSKCDLLIEALLGTGSTGRPRGIISQAIEIINKVNLPVLAIDIPAGVDPGTGEVYEPHITSIKTITFAALKSAHLFYPAKECSKDVEVADIGIPQQIINANTSIEVLTEKQVKNLFPSRPCNSHKGTFGTVGVVAGSKFMSGAGVLTLLGALHSGCGLVRWAGPHSIATVIATRVIEATYIPLPDEDYLSKKSVSQVKQLAQEGAVLAVGPGIGLKKDTQDFVQEILSDPCGKMVIDADGLNHLAANPQVLNPDILITPHPKEMSRLLGVDLDFVKNNPLVAVQQAAKKYQAVVLLKGSPTLIANPAQDIILSPAGNPVLAVGGSGDVLTGIIAGLMAQGMETFWAAALGAFWHGKTAEIVARDIADVGITSAELVGFLAKAKQEICREHGREQYEQFTYKSCLGRS